MAAKETIKEAKKELFNMKEKKIKVNPREFEEYVRILYEKNFARLTKELKIDKKIKNQEKTLNSNILFKISNGKFK